MSGSGRDDDDDTFGIKAKPRVDAVAPTPQTGHDPTQQRFGADTAHQVAKPGAATLVSGSGGHGGAIARPAYNQALTYQSRESIAPVMPLHGPGETPQVPVTLPPALTILTMNPMVLANRLRIFIPAAQFADIQAAAADRVQLQALVRVVFEQITAQVNASDNGAAKAALMAAAAQPVTAAENYYKAATLLKVQGKGSPGQAVGAVAKPAAAQPLSPGVDLSFEKANNQSSTNLSAASAPAASNASAGQAAHPAQHVAAMAPAHVGKAAASAAPAPTVASRDVTVSQLAGDIIVKPDKLTVVYRASWVARDPAAHLLQGLHALRAAGAIRWATDNALAQVVALTPLDKLPSKNNQIVLQITAPIFAVIGLPPGQDAVVGRHGKGLGLSIAMTTNVPIEMAVTLPEAERAKVAEAVYAFTKLPIVTEPETLRGRVGGAGVYVELSERLCNAMFGELAWQKFVKKQPPRSLPRKKSAAESAQADYTMGELPARLTQHGGEVVSGDDVPFEVVVDWDLVQLGLFLPAQRAAFVNRKSAYDVAWRIGRVGEDATTLVAVTRGAGQDALKKRLKLALKPGEVSADFKVTAKIGSNHFLPALVDTLVTVKTAAARIAEGRAEIVGPQAGAFAADAMTAKPMDFDLGWAKDAIAKRKDDHGVRYDGAMAADHVSQTPAERTATRNLRIAELEAARDYLRQKVQAKDVQAAIASFDQQIQKLRDAGKQLERDVAAGWQMFDVRGTYVSRTEGVASGPLDLYGEVMTSGSMMGQLVAVRIRDLSRRVEQEAYVFNAVAPTFDAALTAAFVDFCKAYPTGTVALFAQAMAPAAKLSATGAAPEAGTGAAAPAAPRMQPTGNMVGFELATTSRWKDIKTAIVDPAAQVLMGAATSMAMIFAPYVAAPLMVAQMIVGSAITVDDMFEKSSRGTLQTKDMMVGLGQLAMNLLPMLAHGRLASAGVRAEATLARAEAAEVGAVAGGKPATIAQAGKGVDKALRKVVQPSQMIRYVTFAGMVGGNVLIMRAETLALLAQLQAQDVAAIAELHLELIRLSSTMHASDPRLVDVTRALEARAAGVRGRFAEALNTVVGGQLAMLIPQEMWGMMEASSAHAAKAPRRTTEGGTPDGGAVKPATTHDQSTAKAKDVTGGDADSVAPTKTDHGPADSSGPAASPTSTPVAAEARAPSTTVTDETLIKAGKSGTQPRVLGDAVPDQVGSTDHGAPQPQARTVQVGHAKESQEVHPSARQPVGDSEHAAGGASTSAQKVAATPGQRFVLAGADGHLRAGAARAKPRAGYIDVVIHGSTDHFLLMAAAFR